MGNPSNSDRAYVPGNYPELRDIFSFDPLFSNILSAPNAGQSKSQGRSLPFLGIRLLFVFVHWQSDSPVFNWNARPGCCSASNFLQFRWCSLAGSGRKSRDAARRELHQGDWIRFKESRKIIPLAKRPVVFRSSIEERQVLRIGWRKTFSFEHFSPKEFSREQIPERWPNF